MPFSIFVITRTNCGGSASFVEMEGNEISSELNEWKNISRLRKRVKKKKSKEMIRCERVAVLRNVSRDVKDERYKEIRIFTGSTLTMSIFPRISFTMRMLQKAVLFAFSVPNSSNCPVAVFQRFTCSGLAINIAVSALFLKSGRHTAAARHGSTSCNSPLRPITIETNCLEMNERREDLREINCLSVIIYQKVARRVYICLTDKRRCFIIAVTRAYHCAPTITSTRLRRAKKVEIARIHAFSPCRVDRALIDRFVMSGEKQLSILLRRVSLLIIVYTHTRIRVHKHFCTFSLDWHNV